MSALFHKNRIIALFFGFFAVILYWYCLVLIANPENDISIDNMQWLGLIAAIIIGVMIWLRNCLVIRPG
jgi:hypothetical protein